MHHDAANQTNLFAANTLGSVWWMADILYRNGPSWAVLPPILIGATGLVGALRGYQNDRQSRRHKEEIHQSDMAARWRRPR